MLQAQLVLLEKMERSYEKNKGKLDVNLLFSENQLSNIITSCMFELYSHLTNVYMCLQKVYTNSKRQSC